jgi:diaminopimelate epimerase
MVVRFKKMNGAGNDFVVIDNRERPIRPSEKTIRELCDRKRGIGADGVILIEAEPQADFRMRYFNSDGGEAEMCGNGARCAALFASDIGLGTRDGETVQLRFFARPGPMTAVVHGDRAAIAMTDATRLESLISLPCAGGPEVVHFINTGVPHAVSVEKDWESLSDEQVLKRGREIRFHQRFSPGGANANFVRVREGGLVAIRTYERGVEAETLACGTGAVAAAVVLFHLGLVESPVRVITRGDELLRVSFTSTVTGATDVVLEGPAAFNFDGAIDLSRKE